MPASIRAPCHSWWTRSKLPKDKIGLGNMRRQDFLKKQDNLFFKEMIFSKPGNTCTRALTLERVDEKDDSRVIPGGRGGNAERAISGSFRRQVTVKGTSGVLYPQNQGCTFPYSVPTEAASCLCVYFTILMGKECFHSWNREQIFWQWVWTVLLHLRPFNQGTELPGILIWQVSGMFWSQMGGTQSLALWVTSAWTAWFQSTTLPTCVSQLASTFINK